ncbi:MAG: nucleotidyl transferase AbiEii/AbiGii toxin family protein [Candidatus Roizmanbacteria bacterium]|nr:nucleotidyl transferase AbiEii/AbiGii toxin family protein [Candidatus Roizmanbacteria bacterium]
MGKTILTSKQLEFLELIKLEPQITKRFYLADGTALAEFYLKHRLSEDIDLFTEEKEVDQKLIDAYLKKISTRLLIKKINRSVFMGLVSYFIIYKDGGKLKVDFNYYPFPRIENGLKFGKLQIDSIRDIAANKVHTIFINPRDRDYIDLYFIMKTQNLNLNQLIIDAKSKFDWDIDRLTLVSQLLRVKEIKILETPKMIIPFNKKEMDNFFIEETRKLDVSILKT